MTLSWVGSPVLAPGTQGATVPLLMLLLLTLSQVFLLESVCLRTHQFFLYFFLQDSEMLMTQGQGL